MKKWVAVLMALLLMLGVNCALAKGYRSGDFRYEVQEDGTAKITGFYGQYYTDLVIPSELDGYRVTVIGDSAFSGCWTLTNVMIPEGVTTIERNAFYHCYSMTSVAIPDTLTSIGFQAFVECEKLKAVVLPEGLVSIGASAFLNCYALQTVVMPSTVTDIGETAFNYCSSLKSMIIPEGVTVIEPYTFSNCKALDEVYIPDSVTEIGESAFYKCYSLSLYIVPGSYAQEWAEESFRSYTEYTEVPPYTEEGIYSYVVLEDGTAKITGYTGSERDVVLPARIDGYPVTAIGAKAFQNCFTFKNVTIPEGVVSIGDQAFAGCTYLLDIVFPRSLRSIGARSYEGCPYLLSINIPKGVESIGEHAFTSAVYACIVVPDSVQQIGDGAFEFSYWSRIFVCYDSYAEYWAERNYFDCEYIEGVYYDLQDDGTAIITGASGDREEWVIPAEIDGYKVTAIGARAFERCSKMKRLAIPNSVTYIDDDALRGCSALQTVVVERGSYAGAWVQKKTYQCEFVTPAGHLLYGDFTYRVQEDATILIVHYAGEGNGNVEIPSSIDGMPVTAIGDYAFFGAIQRSVVIPDTVVNFGVNVFSSRRARGNSYPVLSVTSGSYAEEWAKANGFAIVYPE